MDKTISRWETGNAYPDIALLDDLAAALSVSVEELCRGEKLVRPSADTNTLLGDVISEVKQQKKRQSREMASHSLSQYFFCDAPCVSLLYWRFLIYTK